MIFARWIPTEINGYCCLTAYRDDYVDSGFSDTSQTLELPISLGWQVFLLEYGADQKMLLQVNGVLIDWYEFRWSQFVPTARTPSNWAGL